MTPVIRIILVGVLLTVIHLALPDRPLVGWIEFAAMGLVAAAMFFKAAGVLSSRARLNNLGALMAMGCAISGPRIWPAQGTTLVLVGTLLALIFMLDDLAKLFGSGATSSTSGQPPR